MNSYGSFGRGPQIINANQTYLPLPLAPIHTLRVIFIEVDADKGYINLIQWHQKSIGTNMLYQSEFEKQ